MRKNERTRTCAHLLARLAFQSNQQVPHHCFAVDARNAAPAYLPSLTAKPAPAPAGYQVIAKKYMKNGVFLLYGIGVAE